MKRYEQLLQLPVFQGITSDSVKALIEKIPFHFIKRADGEAVVTAGERCNNLLFLVAGTVRHEVAFEHLDITFSQRIEAPSVLALENLFGLDTTLRFNATAVGQCGLLQVRKADFITMLQQEKIILFNTLNMLSSATQRYAARLRAMHHDSVGERILALRDMLGVQQASAQVLTFKPAHLCTLLSTRRPSLADELNRLAEQGAVQIISPTQIQFLNP